MKVYQLEQRLNTILEEQPESSQGFGDLAEYMLLVKQLPPELRGGYVTKSKDINWRE